MFYCNQKMDLVCENFGFLRNFMFPFVNKVKISEFFSYQHKCVNFSHSVVREKIHRILLVNYS